MTELAYLMLLGLLLLRQVTQICPKLATQQPKFHIEYLSSSEGIMIDHLKDHLPMTHFIKIKQKNQHSILEMSPSVNYTIQIYIEIMDGIDQYSEVLQTHNENRFVFESHPNSDIYHFRRPLLSITQNFCKHPLPKYYNIIMDSYKNRATVAYAVSCNSTMSDGCSNNKNYGNVYYKKTLSKECLWMEYGKAVTLDEPLEQLDESLNSFYCTENSLLLNAYFNEKINENIQFLSYPECEVAKARCIDCQMLRCRNSHQCCHTIANCLLQEPCQIYYNVSCYRSYETNWYSQKSRCMKGTTYKFTLTPEFDFKTDEFMCYLKKEKHQPKITFSLTFSDKKSKFMKSKSVKYHGQFSSNVLEFGDIKMVLIPSLINSMDNIILERKKFEYQIYSLKQSNQFDKTQPHIHKLFSKSFIKVQMSQPFLYNTETWSNEKCFINISNIHTEQPIYNPSSKIPVEIINKRLSKGMEEKSLFTYTMIPKGLESPKIGIHISEKSSLLSFYFCRNKNLRQPSGLEADIKNIETSIWRLHIKGTINDEISFFSISLSNNWVGDNSFYKADIVVSKVTTDFNLSFQISIPESDFSHSIQTFVLNLDQCGQSIYRKLVFLNQTDQTNKMKDLEDSERSVDISNFILVIILTTICLCFFYFLLLAFQAGRRSLLIDNSKIYAPPKKVSRKMNYKLFLKIICYMTLKLFYTVSFTLSLVLSVCLSLDVFTIHSMNPSHSMSMKPSDTHSTNKMDKSNSVCSNISKSISKHFLYKISQQINSQENVRTTSGQSVQAYTVQMIENISINGFQDKIRKLIHSQDRSFQRELHRIINININAYKRLNESKWLTVLHRWNSSSTNENPLINSDSFPSKDYVKLSNLVEIHQFLSILQNCEYLLNKLSREQERLKFTIKRLDNEFIFNNSFLLGHQKRYFNSYHQTNIYRNITMDGEKIRLLNKSADFITLDIFKIRLVFMLIDAALILYRCYWTYMDIRQMWSPKKQLIHFNQIILKANHTPTNVRTKSAIVQWTKHHHLECLISTHLAIAAIIIFLSIICINLLVLLTSRDHSNWLSKKVGNVLHIRSLKEVKEELTKFNNLHINPVHRQWQSQKISKLKQYMSYRKEAINHIMHFELFLNHQYLYELCHLQNISSVPKRALDFCQSLLPNNQIIPNTLCDRSLKFAPTLSFNLSSYSTFRTIIYIYQPLYMVLNILALVLFATSVVGILKVIRKVLENKIFSGGKLNHIFLKTQKSINQIIVKNPRNLIQMKPLRFIPNVYNSNLEPPNKYQCKTDPSVL